MPGSYKASIDSRGQLDYCFATLYSTKAGKGKCLRSEQQASWKRLSVDTLAKHNDLVL